MAISVPPYSKSWANLRRHGIVIVIIGGERRMFCSSCGSDVPRKLSYCQRCGAKMAAAKGEHSDQQAELFSESLVWAIVAVFIVGLGAIIGLMAVMKEVVGFNADFILAVTVLSFLLMFVVEGVFIWMLLKRKKSAKEAGEEGLIKEHAAKELDPAGARALGEAAPGVTEHTTRAFEPILSERKSN